MALRLVNEEEITALQESQRTLIERIAEYEEQIRLYREQMERLKESVSFLQNMSSLWYRPQWGANYSGWEYMEFDLSRPRENTPIYAFGFGFVIESSTGQAIIRLNDVSAPAIDTRKVRALQAFFYEMYLSNEAQADTALKMWVCHDIRAWYSLAPEFRRSYTDYDVINISNTTPFTDQEYAISGNYVTVIQSSGTWSIKFNKVDKPGLKLERGDVIQMDFDRIFVSGAGDGGLIQLYIGKES